MSTESPSPAIEVLKNCISRLYDIESEEGNGEAMASMEIRNEALNSIVDEIEALKARIGELASSRNFVGCAEEPGYEDDKQGERVCHIQAHGYEIVVTVDKRNEGNRARIQLDVVHKKDDDSELETDGLSFAILKSTDAAGCYEIELMSSAGHEVAECYKQEATLKQWLYALNRYDPDKEANRLSIAQSAMNAMLPAISNLPTNQIEIKQCCQTALFIADTMLEQSKQRRRS